MGFLVLNNARTTLSGAVSIGDTSLSVVDGSSFAVGSDYSYITLENNSGQIETVKLTARSGGTLTIAAPGAAYNWASGSIVECRPCSQAVAAIVDVSASNVLKKITWANVKATLKTYLDTLYQSLTGDITLAAGKAVIFEGTTDDAYETTLTAADPTADRTITLPDYTGTTQVQARGADIASAGTINLSTATGDIVDVTGTTAITAITLADGLEKNVRFTGALTLTNGASLVLPGAADITTSAGDTATFRGYAAGLVRCVAYQRAAVAPLVAPGTSGNVLTSNGSAWASTAPVSAITLKTPVGPSGTSVASFTGIPAGTKRITVHLLSISTSGTADLQIQLGDSGGYEAASYLGGVGDRGNEVANSTGFNLIRTVAAVGTYSGSVILSRENPTLHRWSLQGIIALESSGQPSYSAGNKELSAELDRVQVITTDTFDAGEINISYE